MANKSLLPDGVVRYVVDTLVRETDAQKALRAETAKMANAMMQISADQGAFLAWLVRTIGARRTLEIGTFTGYSALTVALALPADGRVVACDINVEWTNLGKRYWQNAGVADKIDLRIAPAIETLATLDAGTFDFAFIDADKPGYPAYYEAALRLVRKGGVIALDNMLWSGKVADEIVQDEDTKVLRALNATIAADARVDCSLVTVGDGMMLATKR